jgi:hypothetical protein
MKFFEKIGSMLPGGEKGSEVEFDQLPDPVNQALKKFSAKYMDANEAGFLRLHTVKQIEGEGGLQYTIEGEISYHAHGRLVNKNNATFRINEDGSVESAEVDGHDVTNSEEEKE